MTRAWIGDWYQRIKERVREHGFATVTAFVGSHSTDSFISLARILAENRDIAADQIRRVYLLEAEESGTIERCARDLLLRELHQRLPEGWHEQWDEDTLYRRARAFSRVYATIGEAHESAIERICDAIDKIEIPKGWLPASPDDPILLEIFEHWHDPKASGDPS